MLLRIRRVVVTCTCIEGGKICVNVESKSASRGIAACHDASVGAPGGACLLYERKWGEHPKKQRTTSCTRTHGSFLSYRYVCVVGTAWQGALERIYI